jgi:2,3-bisphosphoglycerate-independent phosphoglycerate mutase
MLDKYDLVFSHIEAPDEASHQADYKTKVAAIEHHRQARRRPVLEKIRNYPEWRILVMPDHRRTSPRESTATRRRCSPWPARA